MNPIMLYILYSAKRDRFILGLILGVVFSSFLAAFLGSTSLVEADQMRVIYSGNLSRAIIMIGIMVFISFQVKKMFENKEMDVFFSRIPSKTSIVFSFLLSFFAIAFTLIAATTIVMAVIYPSELINILYWSSTLLLESLVVISFSLFFSIVMTSSSLGLLMCFASYFISRVIGSFVAYINLSHVHASWVSASELVLKTTSVVIPRLDLYGKTGFIVYGNYDLSGFLIIFAQSIAYSILLCSLAVFDLKNKEF